MKYFSAKKEQNFETLSVDESPNNYAEWKKPGQKSIYRIFDPII